LKGKLTMLVCNFGYCSRLIGHLGRRSRLGRSALKTRLFIMRSPADLESSTIEPDPRDLLVPFPSEPMKIWPISTRVNKPQNDDAEILDPVT